MEIPLRYNDIENDKKMKSQFNQLRFAIFSTDENSEDADIEAVNELVQREVTAKPILARIVNQGNTSLLVYFCTTRRHNEQFHPAIKRIIGANPSALLWRTASGTKLIHMIAAHPSHCVLMPWIATNYQWVLDHEICLEEPPVFNLLHEYIYRKETGCTAAIIRQFFEAYPQGLTQVNEYGHTPLHLFGPAEYDAALFTWMAEQCPSKMLQTNREGETPLHVACISLTHHRGSNSSEICKYLIEQCPESVRIPGSEENHSMLPIHILLRHCQHRLVKEVVVSLLRAYPESYDMTASGGRVPRSKPFVQRIKPLLDEERELKENVAYLHEVSGAFQDAVNGTENPSPLASSTCHSFCNWATVTSIQRLDSRLVQNSTELQDECNAD